MTTIILVGAFSHQTGDCSPGEFVSATVFLTTVVSAVTVTVLVWLLQSGLVL